MWNIACFYMEKTCHIQQGFNMFKCLSVHIPEPILVITIPADALAPNGNGARASAGTVLTTKTWVFIIIIFIINDFKFVFTD